MMLSPMNLPILQTGLKILYVLCIVMFDNVCVLLKACHNTLVELIFFYDFITSIFIYNVFESSALEFFVIGYF